MPFIIYAIIVRCMIPKISVLVPVYNVEKYIQKCADSLFSNTISSSCEFIFTNDCSTDSSVKELQKVISHYPELENNITLINHEKNYGLGKTRNTGFDNAKGEYIICVDSDDWVEPDYLETLYNTAKENDADIVGCDAFFVDEEKNASKVVSYSLDKSGQQCLIDLFNMKIGGYLWIKLIKRSFLIEHQIRWADDVSMWEDVLIDTKIFTNNPVINYIRKPLYHYLIRKGSYLHTLYTEQKANDIFNTIQYIKEYLEQNEYNYAIDILLKRSYLLKYEIISKGNKNTQKKYLNEYKELNKYMTSDNTKKIYRFIFKLSNKFNVLPFIILFIFTFFKILIGRISYKEYFGSK